MSERCIRVASENEETFTLQMTEGKVSEAEGRLHTGSWEDVVLWEN